jgi:VWFA-related protein
MSRRSTRVAWACAVGLLAGAPCAPRLGAQAPQGARPDLLPAQRVEVVRVEVVVTEKRGRPRTGLGREDFAIFEDGKPQQIVQFLAFARPQPKASPAGSAAATPAASAAATPATPQEPADEPMLPARYVVLAVDDVHMETDSLARFRKALARVLREDLRPEDQVALVTTSGASALSQEFTSDRALLQQILSRLSAKGRLPEWTGVPNITEYQAELIEGGDPLALDAAVQEILLGGTIQDALTAEAITRRKARAILAGAGYDARLTLETLESLCRGLSGLTGRKALFLVSDGFLTGMTARSGARAFDVRRIVDAATRAGVAIYSLDTRGLVASPPGLSASSPARALPTTFGSIEAMRRQSEEAMRGALNALAADTGGFLVESANDLRGGLQEFLKDTETYYVLAYEPENAARDGSFRSIEVRLPGLSGLKVRTRSGYFAPDDRRAAEVSAAAEDQARRREQRHSEMRSALVSLAPLTAIPVRLSADFLSLDGTSTQLTVTGNVDVSTLPFVRLPDRRQATIETAALVYDGAGAVAATLKTERTAVNVTDADYAELVSRGLTYQGSVALPPGRYQVRLAARDDATGIAGSAWKRLEIPDVASGRLTLSSLFLLKDGGVPASPDAPPVLSSVQALPRFRRGESLYVQLCAYNPQRDVSGGIDLVAQSEVLSDGAVIATASPQPMSEGEPRGTAPHTARIGLQRFEPGDYELRVTVTDRNGSAMAARTVPFTVE